MVLLIVTVLRIEMGVELVEMDERMLRNVD